MLTRPEEVLNTQTSSRKPLIVIIDDEQSMLDLLQDALADLEVRVLTSADPEEGLKIIERERPPIVLLDLNMPKMHGMQVLERIVGFDPGIEVLLLTGDYSTSSAVQAIQKGAADYLTKPVSIATLRARITKSLQEMETKRETFQLDGELVSSFKFQGMVARSPWMLDLFSKMRRISPHFRTVLVTGPSGTGKELVARALHAMSPAGSSAFVVCNCAGIPESLAESEWFGYVKGAFTGANQDKMGLFEHANGGSIFLDEIGEMPLNLQAKLLRVLQSHEIQRVGSPVARKLDVRVIAATNRDLKQEVREKRFREDLYYRLSVVEMKLPTLAERKEDLPLLQRHFVEKFAAEYNKNVGGISRRAQNLLSRYHWPGNIRELENVIGNACMMVDGPVIDIAHLPPELSQPESGGADSPFMSLADLEKNHVRRVMEMVGGNKLRAAEILGISRSTLYNLLGSAESSEKAVKTG
ncbi:MAG: sigma-54-dependent Fis family transcriptional regulator [Acidobacteria bacterium]|nr:sigma-54-dependent Fis family transcriptional regulator [Acidobacteriota bacterium]